MVDSGGSQTLDEFWIDPFHSRQVQNLADATGLSPTNIGNAVTGFLIAKWRYDGGDGSYPNELAAVELQGDTPNQCFRAGDYVRLIRMDRVRKALRSKVRNFGMKAEDAALKLADYLEHTYGQAA